MASRSGSGPTSGWYSADGVKSCWAPRRAPAKRIWLPSTSSRGTTVPGFSSRDIACSATRNDSAPSAICWANSSISGSRYLSVTGVSPSCECASKGHLVGVLEITAYRQSTRQTRHAQVQGCQVSAEICGGRVTLDVGIGRQDHLGDGAVGEPRHQLTDAELLGTDALQRRDRTAEHVVATAELTRPLDRDHVLRLLDDADQRGVTSVVGADAAQICLRDVAAHLAEGGLGLHLHDHVGETADIDRGGGEQVEGDPLRTLGPHAWEAGKLVDQVLEDALIHRSRRGAGVSRRRRS